MNSSLDSSANLYYFRRFLKFVFTLRGILLFAIRATLFILILIPSPLKSVIVFLSAFEAADLPFAAHFRFAFTLDGRGVSSSGSVT